MARTIVGVLHLDGMPPTSVVMRRSWLGLRARLGDGAELARGSDAMVARILAPASTLVVECPATDLGRRRRVIEALSRRVLAVSEVGRRGDDVTVVVADREELAGLRDGARGIPLPVALAALATLVERRPSLTVCCRIGTRRVRQVIRSGRPVAGPPSPGLAELRLEQGHARLPRLSPPGLVALGAALAALAPGSFPPPEPRRGRRLRVAASRAWLWVALSVALLVAASAGHEAARLENELEQLRLELERERWGLREAARSGARR